MTFCLNENYSRMFMFRRFFAFLIFSEFSHYFSSQTSYLSRYKILRMEFFFILEHPLLKEVLYTVTTIKIDNSTMVGTQKITIVIPRLYAYPHINTWDFLRGYLNTKDEFFNKIIHENFFLSYNMLIWYYLSYFGVLQPGCFTYLEI